MGRSFIPLHLDRSLLRLFHQTTISYKKKVNGYLFLQIYVLRARMVSSPGKPPHLVPAYGNNEEIFSIKCDKKGKLHCYYIK